MASALRYEGGRIDIAGVFVGTCTDVTARTGVTVLLLPAGTTGGVDVAGGGPATRETDALRPDNLVPGPDAVVFTGGSAPGLGAVDGVVAYLRSQGRGFLAGRHRIPIVPAAAIFDLGVGDPTSPGPDEGWRAAEQATDAFVREGPHGAGAGATVAKLRAGLSWPSGQGAVTLYTEDGLRVAALVVVNAVGSVLEADGSVLAGADADPLAPLAGTPHATPAVGGHTTLAAVLTNATLDKAALTRVARMAHDGLARSIEPCHTMWDGDTVFALATGPADGHAADPSRVGALGARALAIAVRRAVAAAATP